MDGDTQLVIYPGEQSVQAVDLLPLGDIGIILSNALQCQLLHQVYLIGFLKVLGLQQGHINSLMCAFKTPDSQLKFHKQTSLHRQTYLHMTQVFMTALQKTQSKLFTGHPSLTAWNRMQRTNTNTDLGAV